MSSVEYFDYKKWSHDTENHCGYLINLVSTETPSVKTKSQELNFKTGW